ncbi:hypothetical protein [Streptomyces sp. VRA16 Mangrove soil]|uniref:hypothetical protein n=1 Tax=Streptomyces sp. VRA16 Mangrove soil TaxID=2817434 RepID=UPI001A9D0565|nr:hypothetical protein [Streptomyces sp. VRA16 Mangrove soil]MBO1334941.1 hypothetical protein [Streptomyces sp. VRA16 Mangrove soil]
MKIVRRVGDAPRARGCGTGETCPDIFELSDSNFAVIGTEATEALRGQLPPGVTLGRDERLVIITRKTLIRAKRDLPDA